MARADYAGTLDRHAGEGETLAGSLVVPVTEHIGASGARGHGLVESAAMHGNRWPALFGGFLFDLAYKAAACAVSGRPLSLELHFLRAIRRADVPETGGLKLAWRASRAAPGAAIDNVPTVVTVELGEEGAPIAYGTALFDAHPAAATTTAPPQRASGTRLVLPAHDADWQPGIIRGRCLELPGSLPAIADTLLAKAMSTVRGDGCSADTDEHFLVRTLSYWWIEPLDDALATFEARVVQRGRRMGLAVGTLHADGRTVGRTTGTVAVQQVKRA